MTNDELIKVIEKLEKLNEKFCDGKLGHSEKEGLALKEQLNTVISELKKKA